MDILNRSCIGAWLLAALFVMSAIVGCSADPVINAATKPQIKEVPLAACNADPRWISSPSLPDEIPNQGSTLCDFYQFSWQSFLYLMAPSGVDADLRNFENVAQYPIYNHAATCVPGATENHQVFLRVLKSDDENPHFVLPENTGQAGGGATIFDQQGNVVYYSVLVSRDMCDKALSDDPTAGNLPANAIEMKFAWKVLSPGEIQNYVTINATLGKQKRETTLGLIAMHLVQSTPLHPEMVWASFEYTNNNPNCLSASMPPARGFGFQSTACNACLRNLTDGCLKSCAFNQAEKKVLKTTGTPSQICRLFPEGTDLALTDNNGKRNKDGTVNNNGAQNIADVSSLNSQLIGSLRALPPSNALANYQNLGAIWLTNPAITSQPPSNQRGSLQLENPVAETVFQGTLELDASGELSATSKGTLNCFTCHGYTPDMTASIRLSHVYPHMIPTAVDSKQLAD